MQASTGPPLLLLPEVLSGSLLQARRHGAVHGGLAALCGRLHEQQGREAQQQPQQRNPALNMTTQFGPDHTRVETERRNTGV